MKFPSIVMLGCGHIGSVLARDLIEILPSSQIVILETDVERAKRALGDIGDKVELIKFDLSNFDALTLMLKRCDLAVGLAPGRLGFGTMRACIRAGVNMVDLSYMPEDPMVLHEEALARNVTIVPDCGLAPGLSNMLVGRAFSMLEEVEDVIILVGGIPEKPIPPLSYKVTWCVEDLIEEYTRRAKIVKDGKLMEVEALEGLEVIDFPGIGRLEAFYTDGVRTLHYTIKGVRNMWEKTLRYEGHSEKIKLLRDLGFFSAERIKSIGVSPRELTAQLLEEKLSLPETKDIVVMKVHVKGRKGAHKIVYEYMLMDRQRGNVTAMARTTAYTASAVARLLIKGEIESKGIIPPEIFGMNEKIFNKIMAHLTERGVNVQMFTHN